MSSFFNNSFVEYKIIVWFFFPLSTLNISHWFVQFLLRNQLLILFRICRHDKNWQKLLPESLSFDCLIMSPFASLFVFIIEVDWPWGFRLVSYQLWEVCSHYIFKYSFCPISSCLWISDCVCVLISLMLRCPPKFVCWDPDPQNDGVRRWGLWEVVRSWRWSPHKQN